LPVDDYYCHEDLTAILCLGCGLIGGISGASEGVIAASDALSLDLESVLVYLYESWVLKDSQSIVAHGNDISGDE